MTYFTATEISEIAGTQAGRYAGNVYRTTDDIRFEAYVGGVRFYVEDFGMVHAGNLALAIAWVRYETGRTNECPTTELLAIA